MDGTNAVSYTHLADKNIPMDFYDSKSILITSVHKLFNGLTKFGLRNRSESVGSIAVSYTHLNG